MSQLVVLLCFCHQKLNKNKLTARLASFTLLFSLCPELEATFGCASNKPSFRVEPCTWRWGGWRKGVVGYKQSFFYFICVRVNCIHLQQPSSFFPSRRPPVFFYSFLGLCLCLHFPLLITPSSPPLTPYSGFTFIHNHPPF